MQNFQYYNPVKIIFGEKQITSITSNIPQGSKVLMIYGGGSIKNNGVYEETIAALVGFEFLEFSGVEPNPRYETLMKAVELIRKENVDFLLAVGGGSVVDGTKFIAAATYFEGEDAYEICSKGARVTKTVPFGCILTLPATGSEMNSGGVISRESTKEKFAFNSSLVYPRFSVLDPTTTISLPKKQRANGVVDAFVHVTEQYLTYNVNADIQDRFSEAILSTLIDNGLQYVEHNEDMIAASNIIWASTMALNGLISVGVPCDWATHMIGHEITAFEGLDHAQTLALVWPGLQRVMSASKKEKLLQFSSRVWGISADKSDYERIEEAIIKTEEFFHSLGVGTTVSDYPDMSIGFIDKIVNRFSSRDIKLGENADITAETVREILESRM